MGFFWPEGGGGRSQDFGPRGGGSIAGFPADIRLVHTYYWVEAEAFQIFLGEAKTMINS